MVYYFLRLSQTILQQQLNLSLIAQKGKDGLFGGVSQRRLWQLQKKKKERTTST